MAYRHPASARHGGLGRHGALGRHGGLEALSLILFWLAVGAAVFAMGAALPLGAQELAAHPSDGLDVGGLDVGALGLGSVTLAQSADQLEAILGRPAAVHRTTDTHTGEPARIQVHRGLTAYLVVGRVMRLKTTEPGPTTPAGVQVGDRLDEVVRVYGPAPTPTASRAGVEELRYRVAGTEAYLVFRAFRGRVVEIELELVYA